MSALTPVRELDPFVPVLSTPAVPILSFHSLELLLIAHAARNRARVDSERPNALTTDSIVAVVMAAASTEAFINELAEHARVWREAASDWAPGAVSAALGACADAIDELEESHVPVSGKYLIASLALAGKSFPKDQQPFQDFAELIKLRNAIMHAKVAQEEGRGHQGTKIADALAQRGIATRKEPNTHFTWFNRLEVPAVAAWACESARAIILATLDLIPAPPQPPDPVESLRKSFRTHPGFGPETGL